MCVWEREIESWMRVWVSNSRVCEREQERKRRRERKWCWCLVSLSFTLIASRRIHTFSQFTVSLSLSISILLFGICTSFWCCCICILLLLCAPLMCISCMCMCVYTFLYSIYATQHHIRRENVLVYLLYGKLFAEKRRVGRASVSCTTDNSSSRLIRPRAHGTTKRVSSTTKTNTYITHNVQPVVSTKGSSSNERDR